MLSERVCRCLTESSAASPDSVVVHGPFESLAVGKTRKVPYWLSRGPVHLDYPPPLPGHSVNATGGVLVHTLESAAVHRQIWWYSEDQRWSPIEPGEARNVFFGDVYVLRIHESTGAPGWLKPETYRKIMLKKAKRVIPAADRQYV